MESRPLHQTIDLLTVERLVLQEGFGHGRQGRPVREHDSGGPRPSLSEAPISSGVGSVLASGCRGGPANVRSRSKLLALQSGPAYQLRGREQVERRHGARDILKGHPACAAVGCWRLVDAGPSPLALDGWSPGGTASLGCAESPAPGRHPESRGYTSHPGPSPARRRRGPPYTPACERRLREPPRDTRSACGGTADHADRSDLEPRAVGAEAAASTSGRREPPREASSARQPPGGDSG
jgi:hypothetical protein